MKKLTAIFKTKEENYIPVGVTLRSKISTNLFTGEFDSSILDDLKVDAKLVSFSLSQKLDLIQ